MLVDCIKMSGRCKLFQVDYPRLVLSKVMISMSEGVSTDIKVILDGLNFLNSHWMFSGVNVEIINCNATSLVLALKYLGIAIIQNCTFGNWTFRKVQKAFIISCTNIFDEGFSTSLKFYNSSAFLDNVTIEHENLTGDFSGIFVYNYSLLNIEQSNFVNNTVKQGVVKTVKSSSLIMSNCTVLGNHATEYPGVILANESFVHLKNTYFHGNIAINGSGAIFIERNSSLQINNCTFRNNRVDREFGHGGAILSFNSLIDISCSVFDRNKAYLGGAIHQENSKVKLNQCLFLGNSDTAVTVFGHNEDSYFENNTGQGFGAICGWYHNVLSVSNTTFKHNKQNSKFNYRGPYGTTSRAVGGAAISLYQSVGNITKSGFYNNYAAYVGGTVFIYNSSLSVSDTTFENNAAGKYGGAICGFFSVLNVEYRYFKNNSVLNRGQGGGLFYAENCTMKILNVLFYECHANFGGAIVARFANTTMTNSSLIANAESAIYLFNETSFNINNCTFLNNSTPLNGGAIVCLEYCDVRIVNSNFSRNRAVGGGGAVFVNKIKEMLRFSVQNSSFTYNIANVGGAINSKSDFSISNCYYSNNIATDGGVIASSGTIVMANCCISNNVANGVGGVIEVLNGSLQMSNCLVSNNTANSNGGVVWSTSSTTVITNCIFRMNSALELGGVFFIIGGTTVSRSSSFMNNVAEQQGSVFFPQAHSVINITQSHYFRNQAKDSGGVLVSLGSTKVLISDTEISQNAGNIFGAILIDYNSVLEFNRSQVVNNNAKNRVGALQISSNSLLVAFNSSFKSNKAYVFSSLYIENSTVYLEKCVFVENVPTFYSGTITINAAVMKVANTFFTHNTGYDIDYSTTADHFINRLDTYRCFIQA